MQCFWLISPVRVCRISGTFWLIKLALGTLAFHKKSFSVAAKTAQRIKHLSPEHADQSLDAQNPHKIQAGVAATCDPRTQEAVMGSLGQAG